MKFGFTRSLSQALKTQRKIGRLLEKVFKAPRSNPPKRAAPKLETIPTFGSNPGRLVMKSFTPAKLAKSPPLVVVLHGCRQTPESLDAASGFSKLAKQRGFVLLFPEQTKANNPQSCFNWFRPSAVARDRGEVLSIKQMIEHCCQRHRVDRGRIYVVGLSAGGAIAAAMVANYPGLFAGAAIVAGMPFGAARDAISALRSMKSGPTRPSAGWGGPVAEVSPGSQPWPPISIWQGTEDTVVNPQNAHAAVDQWLEVRGLDRSSGRVERKTWGELHTFPTMSGGQVTFYSIDGMGHGLPVKERPKTTAATISRDPFVVPAAISAPVELMRIWNIKRL